MLPDPPGGVGDDVVGAVVDDERCDAEDVADSLVRRDAVELQSARRVVAGGEHRAEVDVVPGR